MRHLMPQTVKSPRSFREEASVKNLVDTHILLWVVQNSPKLSQKARLLLTEPEDEYWFSAASVWEIAIKRDTKAARLPISAEQARAAFLAAGFKELTVSSLHAAAVESLPKLHKDPFDRMLVAQSRIEGWRLITHDTTLAGYGEWIVCV